MQKSLQIQQDTLRREVNERFSTLLESFGALDESFHRCDDRIKYLEEDRITQIETTLKNTQTSLEIQRDAI
jgi:hypothetical protein